MNFETILLNKLKSLQSQYAIDALRSTGDKSAFDFGYRAGCFAGIEKSIDCLLNLLDEQRNGEPDL